MSMTEAIERAAEARTLKSNTIHDRIIENTLDRLATAHFGRPLRALKRLDQDAVLTLALRKPAPPAK